MPAPLPRLRCSLQSRNVNVYDKHRIVQTAGAAVFAALMPDLGFNTALYHCFITATTGKSSLQF